MRNLESEPINVIILLDEKTTNIARRLGGLAEKRFDVNYTVSDTKYIPHATIYQAQYPKKNYDKIKSVLGDLSKETEAIQVKIGPYELHAGVFLWWNIIKTKELEDLHYKVLRKLNPLRKGLILPFIKPDASGYVAGGEFSKQETYNVKKYGAVVVDKLFQPHVSIGRTKSKINETEMYSCLPKTESVFKAREICVGEMGDHGTVLKIRDRFPFGGKGI